MLCQFGLVRMEHRARRFHVGHALVFNLMPVKVEQGVKTRYFLSSHNGSSDIAPLSAPVAAAAHARSPSQSHFDIFISTSLRTEISCFNCDDKNDRQETGE